MTRKEAIIILDEIKKQAITISMTGRLRQGSEMLLNLYKATIQVVLDNQWVSSSLLDGALFSAASVEEAGIAASIIVALMEKEEPAVPSGINPDL